MAEDDRDYMKTLSVPVWVLLDTSQLGQRGALGSLVAFCGPTTRRFLIFATEERADATVNAAVAAGKSLEKWKIVSLAILDSILAHAQSAGDSVFGLILPGDPLGEFHLHEIGTIRASLAFIFAIENEQARTD